jgi:hypothetical protein
MKIKISEAEFEKICNDIAKDAETICKFNPIGTREETLLWMLLGVLINYLSLSDLETPCFPNSSAKADAYRKAILHVLRNRKAAPFEAEKYIDRMIEKNDN